MAEYLNAEEVATELEGRGEVDVRAVWHNVRMADSVYFKVADVQFHNESGTVLIILDKE